MPNVFRWVMSRLLGPFAPCSWGSFRAFSWPGPPLSSQVGGSERRVFPGRASLLHLHKWNVANDVVLKGLDALRSPLSPTIPGDDIGVLFSSALRPSGSFFSIRGTIPYSSFS